MIEQFNSMLYYNMTEINEAMIDFFEAEYLYDYLLAMWLKFYPSTDRYDLAYVKCLAEDYAIEYMFAKRKAFNV